MTSEKLAPKGVQAVAGQNKLHWGVFAEKVATKLKRPRFGARNRVAIAFAVLALLLWGFALPSVEVERISGWGLLTGLPTIWYLAYVSALLAVVMAVVAKPASLPAIVTAFLIFLILLMATTSVKYGVPRYSWSYKHIGVTEYLMAQGAPARDVDIYQNFPGFFYLIGLIHILTGIPVMLMARYSELVFSALTAAAIYWTLGALTRSAHVRVVTAIMFTLTNWLGQTYFSPQSAAFPVSIVVIGIFLRAVASRRWRPNSGQILQQLWAGRPVWTSSAGLILCVVLYTFVVISHQFTAAALLLQLAALTALFRLRRPWLIFVFSLVLFAWLVQAYPYFSRHSSLFDVSRYESIRPPPALDPVLSGADVMAEVPYLITLHVALATLTGAALTIIRTRSVVSLLVPAFLAAAPALIMVGQPHGQEVILRCYLFALPWCCFVIVRDLFRVDLLPDLRRITLILTPVLISLGVLAVPANLGHEMINHIYPADVTADQWFEEKTPPGSELLLVVPAHPTRTTRWYDLHFLHEDSLSPSLLREAPGIDAPTTTGRDLVTFTRSYVESRSGGQDMYLAIGPTQRSYMELYGLIEESTIDDYIARLKRDPNFLLVYERHGSYLFQAF